MKINKRIYLDYASTTPIDPKVLKAMLPFMTKHYGNPSALYKEGVEAKKVVTQARITIAQILNVKPEEIIFTASGTESDNLAVLGLYNAYKNQFRPHIITTTIEHPGILETCKHIEAEGGEVSYIPVEPSGIVDPQKIKAALTSTTILVSVMYANNEIGTIQPLHQISRIIQEYKKNSKTQFPFMHTDSSQAGNYLDLNFQKTGIDLMTLDASKIYGPKGSGLLAVKRYVPLRPIIFGGGQEKGLRAGTEHVSHIVGFSTALALADSLRDKETKRLEKLKDYFISSVIKSVPGVSSNGDSQKKLPNNVNICIPGLDAEFAVIKLDQRGIACSSASSCMNLSENSYSYVVDAVNPICRESSLRFTLGRATTKKEIDLTLREIRNIISTQ